MPRVQMLRHLMCKVRIGQNFIVAVAWFLFSFLYKTWKKKKKRLVNWCILWNGVPDVLLECYRIFPLKYWLYYVHMLVTNWGSLVVLWMRSNGIDPFGLHVYCWLIMLHWCASFCLRLFLACELRNNYMRIELRSTKYISSASLTCYIEKGLTF